MNGLLKLTALWSAGALFTACSSPLVLAAKPGFMVTKLGTYSSGIYNAGGAEIVAHDATSHRLYVVNAKNVSLDVLSIADPTTPTKIDSVSFSRLGGTANSVAVHDGLVAVALEATPKMSPGKVVFLDANLNTLNVLEVGSQPDMVTFSPNGRFVLVANEGEPNTYNDFGMSTNGPSIDPEGSVSVINISAGAANITQADVRTADFRAFNAPGRVPAGVRIFGPNASVAQDLEPEYITVSHDSQTAWVTLQENNALAVVDIRSATVTELLPLGYKDHSLAGNGLDTSNRDNPGTNAPAVNIRTWPGLKGLYQPDTIASYKVGGETYLVMANEGEARTDWPGFSDEARVSALTLAPVFDPSVKFVSQLGDLRVARNLGAVNGVHHELYAFGSRSFSIRNAAGELVFDSGDMFERITGAVFPDNFNASNTGNALDGRSPNKGPEPEALAVGKAYGRTFAFVGLERIGGVMVFDISQPQEPDFVTYFNNRNFKETPGLKDGKVLGGDLGPECIVFINEEQSPNGKPIIVVGNEISGTTSLFQFSFEPRN